MKLRIAAAAVLAVLASCGDSTGDRPDANASTNAGANATAVVNASSADQAGDDGDMVRFVNSTAKATSEGLRRNYVDFSFAYPAGWIVTPQRNDGTDRNYVRVAPPPIDGYEPFAFHVGYASANSEAERAGLEQSVPQLADEFGSSMQDYRVTSIGRDQVGAYESFGWRFSATAPAVVKGGQPAQIYGRGDIVLPPGATRGVTIISLVTDRTDEARGPAEVGEAGTLKAVFDSFQLGGSGGK
jgi:hypothetical protein